MEPPSAPNDFRNGILKLLRERNYINNRFSDLISSHNQLYEGVYDLRQENFQLNIQLEKMRQDNLDLQVKVEAGGSGEKSERYSALEQKLYRAQEELTEVHRTKGANAQQLINLNLALQETEKEKNLANDQVLEKVGEIQVLHQKLEDLEQKYHESLQVNQTLRDEHKALHLMCNTLETKLRESQAENAELAQRCIDLKNEQILRFNKEQEEKKKTVHQTIVSSSPNQTSDLKSNGSPPNPAESGSPNKTIKKFTDSISAFFGSKTTTTRPPPTENSEPRSPSVHQGCLYVTVPVRSRCKWKAHDGEVISVKFSASGEQLATGGSDRVIKLWSIVGDKCMQDHVLRGSNGGVTNIEFDPHEQVLIACSNDYAVRLWTIATQRLKLTLTGHAGKVLSARYLGYGHKLVSGSNDRTVKVWDLKEGSCVKTYLAGSSCNDLVTTDLSGECVASGHFDRKLRFYDTRSGSSANFELMIGGRITSLDTPSDKTSILCCTKDHKLEIVDLRKRSVIKTFSHDRFRVATDYSRCAFSPDGQYVAVGSSDGSLLVWNAINGEIVTTVHEHDDPVISCSWNGGNLVSGDKSRNCVLWCGT